MKLFKFIANLQKLKKGKHLEYILMYKLELKPYKAIKGVKYKMIQLTDIKLHTSKRRPTPSFGKKVRESFESNTPGRIYNTIPEIPVAQDNKSYIIELLRLDPDFMKMVQEEEAKGYKILLSIPKEGIPAMPGEDTIEFMNSKNGKRILRGIDKGKK